MKKKVVAIITVSSVGLLLGGLIYLGVSSFPELLESEKEKAVKAKKEQHAAPFVSNTIIVENEKFVEEPATEVVASSGGYATSDYIPSSFNIDEIEYIDIPRNIELTITTIKDEENYQFVEIVDAPISETSVVTIDEPISVEISQEEPVIEEHVSYISSSQEKEAAPVHASKVKKAKSGYKNTVRSNEALIETSLIVVGAVDLISVILIKRKRHLFR